jgi:hypothetical protein
MAGCCRRIAARKGLRGMIGHDDARV